MKNENAIKISCPSIFAEEPANTVTNKYSFIPTYKLINDFERLGWEIPMNRLPRSQKSHTDIVHTKHMVVLRSNDLPAINGINPELIMINSHDKTTSFNFMVGLFRFVCSNGLIIGDALSRTKVNHIRYSFEDIQAITDTVVKSVPELIKRMNRLQNARLTPSLQMEFAIHAIALRFKEYEDAQTKLINTKAIRDAIDLESFLNPVRTEDAENTIWNTFNRIQEKLLKGNFQRIGFDDGISKKVKAVTNIKLDMSLNQGLWKLAESYIK